MTTRPLDSRLLVADAPRGRAVTDATTRLQAILAIGFAIALTLVLQGYQFGGSNHTVYLLDALRRQSPELLANDWFATQTLQYHAAFGWITRTLMRVHAVEPAFLLGYFALVVLFHLATWRLVRVLGGGSSAFLVAEAAFHLSAAGTALGHYQFLQDSAFLPSNVAAVALLWGIVGWLERRPIRSGAAVGVAGLFHLNYALVGPITWAVLARYPARGRDDHVGNRRSVAVATVLALVPALLNVAFALGAAARRSGAMPLEEFVELYVRLRHPHHYDPASWPAWLWIAFLWPMPLALMAWSRRRRGGQLTPAWRDAGRFFALFAAILLIALVGAGLTYLSETLVQASLWRFSVFLKLLGCVGAAFLLLDVAPRRFSTIAAPAAAVALCLPVIAIALVRGPYLGLFRMPTDDRGYLAACDWIAVHTLADAIFLVPPSEQSFRLRARRAIVVNYKAVPQLSGELSQWRQRMEDVLDLRPPATPRGLASLPTPFPATLAAIRQRYDALPPDHLERVARQYGARYLLVSRRLPDHWEPRRVAMNGSDGWFLYDLVQPP